MCIYLRGHSHQAFSRFDATNNVSQSQQAEGASEQLRYADAISLAF